MSSPPAAIIIPLGLSLIIAELMFRVGTTINYSKRLSTSRKDTPAGSTSSLCNMCGACSVTTVKVLCLHLKVTRETDSADSLDGLDDHITTLGIILIRTYCGSVSVIMMHCACTRV